MALLEPLNIDRFPEDIPGRPLMMNPCPVCGNHLSINGELCSQCKEEQFLDHICSLDTLSFLNKLDELFDGETKDFYPRDGAIVLIYYGTKRELAKAKQWLEAYGARYVESALNISKDRYLEIQLRVNNGTFELI